MTSFDFALKDFYRKRQSNFPFLLIIILIVAFTEFLIYATSTLGINIFVQTTFTNIYYFSGGINSIYIQFITLVQILLISLTVALILTVTISLVVSKKRDIAIMKSLGTLPRKLFNFYLIEVYILFLVGFLCGLILGLISFGIFAFIMSFFNYPIIFQLDFYYTPIMFFSCIIGIFLFTGYAIRKIGRRYVISSFSKDIPYDYDASQKLKFIPKWLASIGFNIKIAIVNTLRKKGEFKRYLILFSIIGLLIFTLGLGTIVLRTSSQEWINNAQGENIVIIGHEDVVYNYSSMYKMFSDPTILINENNINFTAIQYLFNLSDIAEINNIEEIEKIDDRLINFYDVREISGIHLVDDGDSSTIDDYILVGQNRVNNIPIVGVNPENVIQNFEIEGRFFTEEDAYDNMTIGDGLAYNFFDYALDQSLELTALGKTFHISGVSIDSFYSGWAGYVGLDIIQQELNLTTEINFVLLKIKDGAFNDIESQLSDITNNLGPDFTYLRLDNVYQENLIFINRLSIYPMILIIAISVCAILSLYNYQKAGIMEKAKDFLIMHAIGSKIRSMKKILFLEAFFVLIPSLLFSLGIGMIINSLFLFSRVSLPPLYIPIILFLILVGIFIIFNFLSLFPIIKKVKNNFSVNDFSMY